MRSKSQQKRSIYLLKSTKPLQGAETWTVTAVGKRHTDFLRASRNKWEEDFHQPAEGLQQRCQNGRICLARTRQSKCFLMSSDCSRVLIHPIVFRGVMPPTLTLCMPQKDRKASDSLYCSCSVTSTVAT